VFDTPLTRLGVLICYDQCFPEAARELTLRGAQVLAIPNAWAALNQASQERYDFFGRARAAENRRWVLQSNQAGPSDRGDHVYLGYSRIIAPSGEVVAHVPPSHEGLAVAEITPLTFDPTRAGSGWLLQQRRPETYTSIDDTSLYT
jgi:predicted amidohydrolase